jgi:CubicO group peptidase (beta-lactamase class C family)
MAVRYQAYDERTDTGVEFPAGQQIPMAKDTVFDLASVSKLFTSVLAVQQIERGALELEGKVAAYLPEFGGAGKQDITIRHSSPTPRVSAPGSRCTTPRRTRRSSGSSGTRRRSTRRDPRTSTRTST